MDKLKFAFWGTPLLSSQTLDILENNGYTPSIIITSPDTKSGRGMNLNQSPVSIWALKHNIKCLKPEKIDQDFIDNFKKLDISLSVVVAYGKILPESIINIPKLGTINIHYSLLPRYRGASPLESTLLNGDSITGVSIQQMVYKLDSGPILASKEILISVKDTKIDLKNKLIKLGGDLLCEIIPDIIIQKIKPEIQDESAATYCSKIHKEDGEINLNDDGIKNYNKYRAFYEWPGIFFFIPARHNSHSGGEKNNKRIRVKINNAIYENGQFLPKRVTLEGKKEIDYKDFLRQN